jgi:hypothetical protein
MLRVAGEARGAHERRARGELLGGQLARLGGPECGPTERVELEVGSFQDAGLGCWFSSGQCLEPQDQFREVERLGQVVIRAEHEPAAPVRRPQWRVC